MDRATGAQSSQSSSRAAASPGLGEQHAQEHDPALHGVEVDNLVPSFTIGCMSSPLLAGVQRLIKELEDEEDLPVELATRTALTIEYRELAKNHVVYEGLAAALLDHIEWRLDDEDGLPADERRVALRIARRHGLIHVLDALGVETSNIDMHKTHDPAEFRRWGREDDLSADRHHDLQNFDHHRDAVSEGPFATNPIYDRFDDESGP
jgi:hypothetical protein